MLEEVRRARELRGLVTTSDRNPEPGRHRPGLGHSLSDDADAVGQPRPPYVVVGQRRRSRPPRPRSPPRPRPPPPPPLPREPPRSPRSPDATSAGPRSPNSSRSSASNESSNDTVS